MRTGNSIRPTILALAALATATPLAAHEQLATTDLVGAWAAETYALADGTTHRVDGRIFFTARDWQVLFFVLDAEGEVRRGSGEGGSWELSEGRLVLTHRFHLSAGAELPGLPAAELRMTVRGPEGAPTEPTDLRIDGDMMTLHFPSGNRMIFRRRP